MGSIKPVLFELSSQLPGSRVLDGRPGIDPHAMALPKGRNLGVAYARRFIEDAKARGLVKPRLRGLECAAWSSLHLNDGLDSESDPNSLDVEGLRGARPSSARIRRNLEPWGE